MARTSESGWLADERGRVVVALAAIALQALAACYFLLDAALESRDSGVAGTLGLIDLIVGFALIAGLAHTVVLVRRLRADARVSEHALAMARGAMGDLIRHRFTVWSLSPAESEVALFALKGCSIAEIALLRGAAQGTVRSQLSQVYAKAGVGGQPMLMSLFLDDLLDAKPLAHRRSG